jgi:hypothetical protein
MPISRAVAAKVDGSPSARPSRIPLPTFRSRPLIPSPVQLPCHAAGRGQRIDLDKAAVQAQTR